MRGRWIPAVVICGLMTLAGCQNNLKITVQMIEPAEGFGDGEFIPGVSAAEAVSDSIAALRSYQTMLGGLFDALRDVGESENDIRAILGDTATLEIEDAQALVDQGAKLLDEIQDGEKPAALLAKSRVYAGKVTRFLEDARRSWIDFADEYEDTERVRAHIEEVLLPETGRAAETARAAQAKAAGFGGFVATGVHKISPGDPMYRQVLKGKPIGQPFTAVDTGVSGDSTVIFVQESPTQLRIYRVDMDPRQLIQNVIYITDKVLQAATKYLAPLP